MKTLEAFAEAIRSAGIACTLTLADDMYSVDDQIDLTDYPGAYIQISAGREGLLFVPSYWHESDDEDGCFMQATIMTADPVAAAHDAINLHRILSKKG